MKSLGIVSDTHGLFDTHLQELFAGVDHILHAGDICSEEVIEALSEIAPVVAIRGNCDEGLATEHYPEWVFESFGGFQFLMIHDLGKPERPHPSVRTLIEAKKPDFILSGHTHSGLIHPLDGRLYLNPGSAGKKRFRLERSAAIIEFVGADEARITLHSLETHSPMQTLTFGRPPTRRIHF